MRATLRASSDARWTVVAFAIAGFAITFLQSVAFFPMAGHTLAQRALFGYSLLLDATANAALFAPPVHPETVAGYLELRALAPLAILFSAWAFRSATSPSPSPIVPRAAAFVLSTLIAAAAACIGVLAGVASGGESVSGLRLFEAGVLLIALAAACYAICLAIAQLAPRAPAVAAGVLLFLFFLNSLSRIFPSLAYARWVSPFRYYDLSAPLPEGGRFEVGGFLVLVAVAVAGTAIAAVIATRRVALPLRLETTRQPLMAGLLAVPVARNLYPQRAVLAAWCVGFTVLGIVLVKATEATMQDVLALPRTLPGLPQYIFTFATQLLGQSWFEVTLLLLLLLVFGFTARWADDDVQGRVEAVLSAPYSRSSLVLERLMALGIAAAVVIALSGIAAGLTSRWTGLDVDPARFVDACVLLWLFTVVTGAAGLAFASWVPRAAAGLLVAFVLVVYLDDQIGAALRLPSWSQAISPFRLMGAPLTGGIEARSFALLVLLLCAGVGISILLMQRRDVAPGPRSTYER